MAIKLYQCTVCKKPRANTKECQVQYGTVLKTERVCIACLDSGDAIIGAIKKLSPKEREKLVDFVMEKLVTFGKR